MNVATPIADTWGMHGDVGWGWMLSMMVAMVLFWGAIAFLVVWLVRQAFNGQHRIPSESPMEVLDRRFAEGAISVEDYEARREALVAGSSSVGARAGAP